MAVAYRYRCCTQFKCPRRQPPSKAPTPRSHHRRPSRRGQIPIAPAAPSLHTSRGFLPWRLSNAGPRVCRNRRDGPASETLHKNELMQRSKLRVQMPNLLKERKPRRQQRAYTQYRKTDDDGGASQAISRNSIHMTARRKAFTSSLCGVGCHGRCGLECRGSGDRRQAVHGHARQRFHSDLLSRGPFWIAAAKAAAIQAHAHLASRSCCS